ncbi:hypothetical protein GGS26DRAFT_589310 [Hypomontagnella submonticulosa]|nr:hypothetical protein GGS26DRAFT_589310 [Hypomontagnella submonticulosa]
MTVVTKDKGVRKATGEKRGTEKRKRQLEGSIAKQPPPSQLQTRLQIESCVKKRVLRDIVGQLAYQLTSRAISDHLEPSDSPAIQFIASDHVEAADFAIHVIDPTVTVSRLVMFCDGSLTGNRGGFGVTYKLLQGQEGSVDWFNAVYGVHVDGAISMFLEILAIHRALWIAHGEITRLTGSGESILPKVIILSDCIGAINYFQQLLYLEFLPDRRGVPGAFQTSALEPLQRLRHLGSKVEIHWVPGHVGVDSNVRADALASFGAMYASLVPPVQDLQSQHRILALSPFLPTKKFKVIEPVHASNPEIDITHWHSSKMREVTSDLLDIRRSGTSPFIKSLTPSASHQDFKCVKRYKNKRTQLSPKPRKAIKSRVTPRSPLKNTRSPKRKATNAENYVGTIGSLQPPAKRAKITTESMVESIVKGIIEEATPGTTNGDTCVANGRDAYVEDGKDNCVEDGRETSVEDGEIPASAAEKSV